MNGIGEQLAEDPSHLCGIVVKTKPSVSRFEVWTASTSSPGAIGFLSILSFYLLPSFY